MLYYTYIVHENTSTCTVQHSTGACAVHVVCNEARGGVCGLAEVQLPQSEAEGNREQKKIKSHDQSCENV